MNTKVRLFKYVLPHWKRILSGIFFTILMGLNDALLAPAANLFTEGFKDISSSIEEGKALAINLTMKIKFLGERSFDFTGAEECKDALFLFVMALIVLVIFKGIFVFFKELLMNSASQKILMILRNDLYKHLVHLPMRFFDTGKTGEIMSRVTYDVTMIEASMTAFIVITQSAIYTVIFITGMFITDWQLTLLFLIIFPIMGVVLKYFAEKIRNISRRIAVKLADISSFLQETISSIKIVKSYTREDYERERFVKKTDENYKFSIKSVLLVALLKPTNEILSFGGTILIFMVCGLKLMNGSISLGELMQFIVFLSLAYKPIKTLGEVTQTLEKATASAERIFEIIDTKPEPVIQVEKTVELKGIEGNVRFIDVDFSYNKTEKVLDKINIEAKRGETVALVGPSGAGKSTIFNLLMRFYEVERGKVLIDNIDISAILLESLRYHISLVPQETLLFSGTVKENIRYGRLDASDDEVIDAARKANAHIFIKDFPEAYATEIGERGVQLSGGQRQRIAIARAILKNPGILLLDEATSALDTESEALVQEATENLMKGRTTFVIAHRLSTIQNSDIIHVIDKGKIVQSGSHNELLKEEGLYQRLYTMQFKE
ncbi:ABC transporter ATP-binding protein [candidate division KSB1 bacterium]